ncbi:MAG: DUF5777 family beta-barrel protein [Vicinamibacterales bacterium]
MRPIRLHTLAVGTLTAALLVAPPAGAAETDNTAASSAASSAATSTVAQDPSDDLVLNPAQPDFTLVNLPTGLRLARFKSAFRVTHRFGRPLGQGSFGSLVEDFFGFDAGARIGLEYRFGLWDGLQAGIYRTSDRTIEFFTQYNVVRQQDTFPVALDVYLTAEGTNNFKDSYSPGVSAVISRTIGEHAAVYAMPAWVNNTNDLPSEVVDDNSTFLLGFGTRLRIRPTVYVVGEFVPRVAGYDPGDHLLTFAIEKRLGGHAFQLNFSNSTGSTLAQVARSFANSDDWFIGFNISRKFY